MNQSLYVSGVVLQCLARTALLIILGNSRDPFSSELQHPGDCRASRDPCANKAVD
jgi:hypothetical protein